MIGIFFVNRLAQSQQAMNIKGETIFMKAELENTISDIRKSLDLLSKRLNWDTAELRLEELNVLCEDSNLWSNPDTAKKLMRDRQSLFDSVTSFKSLSSELLELIELYEMAEIENDQNLQDETETGLSGLRKLVRLKETEALLNGEVDPNDCFLEINAGAGGTESCDWASMLARMYSRWSEKQDYSIELVSQHVGDEAGLKSVVFKIKGKNAYGWLKSESGVHRLVRISPFDSNSRRHTSFSSVWVYPVIDEDIEIVVPDSEIRTDTYRSSGAGGQHVNTTDSAVRITHIPTGIVVTSSEKSQHQNRANCMSALKSRLYELEIRKKTQSVHDAHENKGDAGWGNQIRSYVLQPYQLIKDLRTNYETSNSQRVLDGDLTDFMSATLALEVSGKTRLQSQKINFG